MVKRLEIHTLDLPDHRLMEAGIDPKTIGHCITHENGYGPRITQHREDSREFDHSRFLGKVDLVYINGSHKFEDVLSDSRAALLMLAPNGVIVWDDYHTTCMPVAEAIDVIAQELQIYRIASTRLVAHRSD